MKIMLNGRACSGKDSVGDILVEKYGFTRISFAKPIYKICEEVFGMKGKDRDLLIAVGQKMRDIDPYVWIKWVLRHIDENKDVKNWVITDVRQSNEYVMCRKNGFMPVRVTSSLENRVERCKKRDGFSPTQQTLDQWESEGEVGADKFKYMEIVNDGTVEELVDQVDSIVKLLFITEGLHD